VESNLSISFTKKDKFNWKALNDWLEERGYSYHSSGEYMIYRNEKASLTLTEYPKKLVVQGKHSSESRELLAKLNSLNEYLVLKGKDFKKYIEIMRLKNGKIICEICLNASSYITTSVDKAGNIKFVAECGHEISTHSPLLISRSRVLPDINRLFARSVSRMIKQGFFEGFEFIIPEYYDKYVENCLSHKSKHRQPYYEELNELNKLASDGKIGIYRLPFTGTIDNCKVERQIEDDKIIGFGQQTQSLILTGDKGMAEKLMLEGLDYILIDQSIDSQLKFRSNDGK